MFPSCLLITLSLELTKYFEDFFFKYKTLNKVTNFVSDCPVGMQVTLLGTDHHCQAMWEALWESTWRWENGTGWVGRIKNVVLVANRDRWDQNADISTTICDQNALKKSCRTENELRSAENILSARVLAVHKYFLP